MDAYTAQRMVLLGIHWQQRSIGISIQLLCQQSKDEGLSTCLGYFRRKLYVISGLFTVPAQQTAEVTLSRRNYHGR